jgi:CheY-specific phosphatase CheX
MKLAALFAQEPEEEVEDIMEDAVGEFLNLQNGLFAVNMSDKGVELNMEPQIYLTNALLCGSQTYYVLPVIAPWGRTDLVLGLLEE